MKMQKSKQPLGDFEDWVDFIMWFPVIIFAMIGYHLPNFLYNKISKFIKKNKEDLK